MPFDGPTEFTYAIRRTNRTPPPPPPPLLHSVSPSVVFVLPGQRPLRQLPGQRRRHRRWRLIWRRRLLLLGSDVGRGLVHARSPVHEEDQHRDGRIGVPVPVSAVAFCVGTQPHPVGPGNDQRPCTCMTSTLFNSPGLCEEFSTVRRGQSLLRIHMDHSQVGAVL